MATRKASSKPKSPASKPKSAKAPPKSAETDVYLLLDRSGSMLTKWEETLGAINGYVKGLADNKLKGATILAAFDRVEKFQFDILRNVTDPKAWVPVTPIDATPRGWTPLYDAVGKIVELAEKNNPAKAVITIMTDGQENTSKEHTRESARTLLDRCRARGWQVVFLGADFDAFSQGASLGNAMAQTLNASAGNYAAATQSLGRGTMAYASGGAGMSFSDDDRLKAAGKVKQNAA